MVNECNVNDCSKCPALVENRSKIVNGKGSLDADLLIIGEAPGESEDKQGKPFVGRSGDVLDEQLQNNDLYLDRTRITNMVRCRPPNNRDPKKSELNNCFPHLQREISVIEPEVILLLGRIPTEYVLQDHDISITNISGNVYTDLETADNINDKTVIPCLHPAATLYNSSYRSIFNETISTVKEHLDNDNIYRKDNEK